MPRPLRLVLLVLFVLMQSIAPWVHAHTGTETGGLLHLPGLESLERHDSDITLNDGLADLDLIVSVPAGVSETKALVKSATAHIDRVLPPWPSLSPAPRSHSFPLPYPQPPPLQHANPAATAHSPRAPPQTHA